MAPSLQAALAAAASFFLITLIFAIIVIVCKSTSNQDYSRRRRRHHHQTRTVPNPELSITIDESASFDPAMNRISMEELKVSTKNFSTDLVIGDGSFGFVYKATLFNGSTVAIKKLDPDAFQGFREFRAEMETLGKLRHRNIVKILGYCVSGLERVLILEFVERGSLDQWIHDISSTNNEQFVKFPLPWETRIKVVRGVANGLAYLHGLETPIIHRDIKASNVLLDSEFEAHIADFGLARRIDASHSHVSTQVAGTLGYMPPEYKEGAGATVKVDVYSFGILMFEVATAERPNLPKVVEEKEVLLIEWVRKMLGQNRHMEMLDSNTPKEGLSEDEVKEYFRIASLCTEESGDRPAMSEVVDLLKKLST
ncbi:PREDICTED: putative serine/threonine-protein kinase [Populus euphratica]|uniref:Serine/threonine-protein kinase n=1 Tax=Populus euphratica TaxID=75702 RepID=A0AAJ6V8L7_POPEU|nr:PREDICTED: putative serine/threonine-protein kinase [Populus euphratica]